MSEAASHAAPALGRYVPALTWLRSDDRRRLGRDVLGSLAAGAVAGTDHVRGYHRRALAAIDADHPAVNDPVVAGCPLSRGRAIARGRP